MNKTRRQEIIFQYLKKCDEDSALSAKRLHEKICSDGHNIHLRTIRRDLEELSISHGIISTETRPEKYYPSKDFSFKYQLELNEETIQTLMIALDNLRLTSHDYFKDSVQSAKNVIYAHLEASLIEDLISSSRKYHFDYSISGKPFVSNVNEFKKIMQALRENKVISCKNNSPYKTSEYNKKTRTFLPLVYVMSSGIPYLIVKDLDDNQFKKVRMTRIKDVKLTNTEEINFTKLKTNLKLEKMLGGYGGIDDNSVEIEVVCSELMIQYFQERKIHQSQKVSKLSKNKYLLNLSCSYGHELVRLLSSFGGEIVSIKPDSLYDDVKNIWKSGVESLKKKRGDL